MYSLFLSSSFENSLTADRRVHSCHVTQSFSPPRNGTRNWNPTTKEAFWFPPRAKRAQRSSRVRIPCLSASGASNNANRLSETQTHKIYFSIIIKTDLFTHSPHHICCQKKPFFLLPSHLLLPLPPLHRLTMKIATSNSQSLLLLSLVALSTISTGTTAFQSSLLPPISHSTTTTTRLATSLSAKQQRRRRLTWKPPFGSRKKPATVASAPNLTPLQQSTIEVAGVPISKTRRLWHGPVGRLLEIKQHLTTNTLEKVPSYKTLLKFCATTVLIWLSEPLLSLVDTTVVGWTQGSASVVQLASLGPATTLME